MAKSNYLTTIAIDTVRSTFNFYSMIENNRSTIAHHIKSYSGGRFDEDFFNKFREAVKEFSENTPSESMRKVTVVLPDSAVLTDAVKIPTMKGAGQMKKTFEITLGGLYRNFRDLRISSYATEQNKQYSTFMITGVQNQIVSEIYAACAENKLLVDTLTYASGAAVCGAMLLNPKLKNASYLLLDIKDVYSRFTFVINGRAVGYYTIPFGLEFLKAPKVIGEDMLFDHSHAELAVLNAKEKAKSKKLTVMADVSDDPDTDLEEDENTEVEQVNKDREYAPLLAESSHKTFMKKTPRKLPKFMLREAPETEEGIAYENFRIFVKWALSLIESNKKITELGRPEFVCVNMPADFSHLIEKTNRESAENKINFTLLPRGEAEAEIAANLELYGGLFPKHINPAVKL